MAKKKIDKDALLDKIVDDYTRRTRSGNAPNIATYIKKYPQLANEIEDLLSSVAMIEGLKQDAFDDTAASSTTSCSIASMKQIGDYVIVREVGRGGMGVVFEAVHQSLGRRVALKVLLQSELESEKQIARFRREAQAAARLHHTNIVSVFGFGEADGYHYYVMEYVDGISLKSAVDSFSEIRGPSKFESITRDSLALEDDLATLSRSEDKTKLNETEFVHEIQTSITPSELLSVSTLPKMGDDQQRHHWVGEIGAQVADALGYSHSLGILHRDIKPANLMLDSKGQVWITDFGLVKIVDEEALTQTGAVLGTPRYLAPESLKGEYDRRSETYCLGLSLYELASLKPAFAPGSHAEVFSRIIHETPTSLSKIDPAIPRDLATIIEKAINKDPQKRYTDAFAMRDDLRAFVEDRPIAARRPTLWEQASRWGRKNPMVASLAALSAILVCATAAVASSAWLVTNKAYGELEAQSAATETAKKEAERNAEEALQNFDRAESNVSLMMESFDGLFTDYLQNQTDGKTELDFDGFRELAGIEISVDAADANYLEKMAGFYERFARENSQNKNLLDESARGWRRVANVNFLVGKSKDAIVSYEKAVACYVEILEQNPDSIDTLLKLVATRSELSNAVRRGGEFLEQNFRPQSLIRENIDAIEAHPRRDDPRVRFALAETLSALASAEVCRLAAEIEIDWDSMATSPNQNSSSRNLDSDRRKKGSSRTLQRYDQQAKSSVERAVEIARSLLNKEPENLDYQILLGKSQCSLGALEASFGEWEAAKKSLQFAVDQFRLLADAHPEETDFQYQAAIAILLIPSDRQDASAGIELRNVQEVADTLASKNPNPEYRQLRIVSRLKLANWLQANNQSEAAMRKLMEAVELVSQSDLKGLALLSMVRTISKSAREISINLSPAERRSLYDRLQEFRSQYRPSGPGWTRSGRSRGGGSTRGRGRPASPGRRGPQ